MLAGLRRSTARCGCSRGSPSCVAGAPCWRSARAAWPGCGWPTGASPSPRSEFERVVVRSERARARGRSARRAATRREFLELDPYDDEDFEELVRDALDELPDLLRSARSSRNVAVVISDDGRRTRRLRALPRRRRHARRRPRPDRRSTATRCAATSATTPTLLRDQVVAHGPPRARPPRRASTSSACAASGFERDGPRSSAHSLAEPSITYHGLDRELLSNRRPRMPEAVIVDAVRTPIGRAFKGSLKDVRADDLAAVPLKALHRAQPRGRLRPDRRRHDGLRRPARASRATTSAATPGCSRASTTTSRPRPSTASAPRRCRPSAWPSTRSRRARATSTSPPASRPSRAPAGARACRRSSTRSSTARRARSTTSTSRWA